MRIFAVFMLCFPLFAVDSFITTEEYAQQLYSNPRGIGCHHCHGDDGKGKVVATYTQKKEQHEFAGPAIDKVPFATFSRALDSRVRGMPRYFLTKNEIRTLYYFLHPELVKKRKEPKAAKEPNGSK
jgi:hypothetical protein